MSGSVMDIAALVLLSAVAAASLEQSRAPTDSVVARADSLVAVGDTSAALVLLDEAVRRDDSNAAVWFARGRIAAERVRGFPDRDGHLVVHDEQWLRVASQSLERAAALAPDSVRYRLAVGRIRLLDKNAKRRETATAEFEQAFDAARRQGDKLLLSEAFDALGMTHWRLFELALNQQSVTLERKKASTDTIEGLPVDLGAKTEVRYRNFTGEWEYFYATDRFDSALVANPMNEHALAHAYMALCAYDRWLDIQQLARKRLAATPWDARSWIALGLASHRLGLTEEATSAFDSAFVLLTAREREFFRLSRILDARRARAFDATRPEERWGFEQIYWLYSDPFWILPGNERRLEFLSRVAYAELRWSDEDYRVHGAETDRGELHIRYGPVPEIAVDRFPDGTPPRALKWIYPLGFKFRFATSSDLAMLALDDGSAMLRDQLRDVMPVMWTNVPLATKVESVQPQVARFRAAGDSLGLVSLARIPIGPAADPRDDSVPSVRGGLAVLTNSGRFLYFDSTTARRASGAARQQLFAWHPAVPNDSVMIRVEIVDLSTRRAYRTVGALAPLPTTGLAMSDLVVAPCLARGSEAPTRWSEIRVDYDADSSCPAGRLSILWQTYHSPPASGGASQRVTVTVAFTERLPQPRGRKPRPPAEEPLEFRLVDGSIGDSTRVASGTGKVVFSWPVERDAPAGLDRVVLQRVRGEPGTYTVTVEVRDTSTGATARSERSLMSVP